MARGRRVKSESAPPPQTKHEMPPARNRKGGPAAPEVTTWDTGSKEMNETWKGAVACLGVAVFFVMTIGIIYWQVVDQPNKNWILKASRSGLLWERRGRSLLLQTLAHERTLVRIDVRGDVGRPELELPFVRDLCWLNRTQFCYSWEALADLHVTLSVHADGAECYELAWTPARCHVRLKDCLSMINVSWYGGAGVGAPTWPINRQNASMQPFVLSDLREKPQAFASPLERYFLASSGVAVLARPDLPLRVGLKGGRRLCLQPPAGPDLPPLRYSVCVAQDVRAAHRHAAGRLSLSPREVPDTEAFGLASWKLLTKVDSAAKVERELRTFSNRLRRHRLGDAIIDLDQHSTDLLWQTEHEEAHGGRRAASGRRSRELPLLKLLNISVTLSPFLAVDSARFRASLAEGADTFWLAVPSPPRGQPVPLLTRWRGKLCVKLNVSDPGAVAWFLDGVASLRAHLGMEAVALEGGERNLFEQTPLAADAYVALLADVASRMGVRAVLSAGTRSSHRPVFVRMSPLRSDWSAEGLKAVIPSLLRHALLGYNFLIPDAVGGSLPGDADEELYIRWLEVASFLPVLSFHTPPWLCGQERVLTLTRTYVDKHRREVAPLLEKYGEEWRRTGDPVYRPVWWLSPLDPRAFAVDDQFLIGDRVLVAPVVEMGARRRDVYLPDGGSRWRDHADGRVFDGGTVLRDYPVPLEAVALFSRQHGRNGAPSRPEAF
ncbi:SITS-binding protein [Stigmatopora nigra]